MKLKKKLGMGIATAVLGLGLIGGGTFAYFSDTAEATANFTAGTLDLSVHPEVIVDVDNLKPGDYMIETFKLKNDGSLPIKEVLLDTEYEVIDAGNNNTEDFGEHIKVDFLFNANQLDNVIYSTTLKDLQSMSPEAIKELRLLFWNKPGLEVGKTHNFVVKFSFKENGLDQNQFQGDSLQLKWLFNAKQTEGERR